MKKAITITFGLIGLIFGLVFSSTKIEAVEITNDISMFYGQISSTTEKFEVYAPHLLGPQQTGYISYGEFIDGWLTKVLDKTNVQAILYFDTMYIEYEDIYNNISYTGNTDLIIFKQNASSDYEVRFYYAGKLKATRLAYDILPIDNPYPFNNLKTLIDETYTAGYNKGYNKGYSIGYNKGIVDGSSTDITTPIAELNNHTLQEVFETGNLYTSGDKTLNQYQFNTNQQVTFIKNHKYYINRTAEVISPYEPTNNNFGVISVVIPPAVYLIPSSQGLGYSSSIYNYIYETKENLELIFYGVNGQDGIDNTIFKDVHIIDITSLGIDNLTVEQMDVYYQQYIENKDNPPQGSDNGYQDGYVNGYDEGVSTVFENGFGGIKNPDTNQFYKDKDSYPYGIGFTDGFESTESGGLWNVLFSALMAPFQVLGIELLPGVTIGMIVAVPLVFGLLAWILSAGKSKK